MDPRQIIDYAAGGQANEFRDALYASIHDKVSAHIEAKKQEIASTLISQPEQEAEASVEDTPVENA